MLNKLSLATGLLALGLLSTGASAQSFLPNVFGDATVGTGQAKLPGNNRYDPYGVTTTRSAPVGYQAGGYGEARRINAAHNRYDVDGVTGDPSHASGAFSVENGIPAPAAQNRFTNY